MLKSSRNREILRFHYSIVLAILVISAFYNVSGQNTDTEASSPSSSPSSSESTTEAPTTTTTTTTTISPSPSTPKDDTIIEQSEEREFDKEVTTILPDDEDDLVSDAIEKFKHDFGTGAGITEIKIVETGFDNPGWLELPVDYNKDLVPPVHAHVQGHTKQTGFKVAVFLNIRSVNAIDIQTEKIKLDIDLYEFWADRRFHGLHWVHNKTENEESREADQQDHLQQVLIEIKKLHPEFVKQIWSPDIIIENSIVIPHNDLTSEPIFSYNSETGFVKYTRLEVLAPCPMHYYYYPLDTQKCALTIRSYKYMSEDVNLDWVKEGAFMNKAKNPNYEIKLDYATKYIRKVNSIQFPNLLDKVDLVHVVWGEKSYDILKFVVSIRRNVSFHMFQTYLPSAFLVTITWLCFILPIGMAASKVGLTMTTMLTLNTMFGSVRTTSPQVTYTKAIDIWMIATVFFAFLSFVEYAVISWLDATKEREENRTKQYEEEMKNKAEMEVFEAANEKMDMKPPHISAKITSNIKLMNPEKFKTYMKLRKMLKKHGLSLISGGFCLFNAIYWGWICAGSEYFSWRVNPEYNDVD